MMQCLAIDDEKLVLDLLEDNIRQVPFLHLVKACRNALEATAVLQTTPIDFSFSIYRCRALTDCSSCKPCRSRP